MSTTKLRSHQDAVYTDPQYEKWVRAKVGHRHRHVWIPWFPWNDWGWRPHTDLETDLYVCDVPDCIAIRCLPSPSTRPRR